MTEPTTINLLPFEAKHIVRTFEDIANTKSRNGKQIHEQSLRRWFHNRFKRSMTPADVELAKSIAR